MEKINGRQLVDVWGEMDQLQQFKLIQNLVQLESQLASMKFPGYGNLYFRHSTKHGGQVIPINDDYCIGPAYNASLVSTVWQSKSCWPMFVISAPSILLDLG